MRIGVVTTSYPRFSGDAAGNFVAGHVAALRTLGHDVEVIAAGDPRSDEPGLTHVASRLFFEGGAPDALERGGNVIEAARFTVRLAAAVARRARRWDRAIAHWLAPSALAALAAIPRRTPLLAIAHGGDVHLLARARLLRPMLALLRARHARLAFASAELRSLAAHHGDVGDAIVQAMGVDLARFAALARGPSAPSTTPPIVLVLARLVPVKGVDVAIAAMAKLRVPARLVIAGDGPDRARLVELARGAPVELVGAVDTFARDELLRAASVVAVPSRVLPNGRSEGTPLVAIEALAAGVPVVASAVGGLRELAGIALVPPDDPSALAAAIEATLATASPPDRLRAAVAHLDWPTVAARLT
jgi:glycosyltransferase involved in cell wall biosynthesis